MLHSDITAPFLQPVIVAAQLAKAGLSQNIPHHPGSTSTTEPSSPVQSESTNSSKPSTSDSASEHKEDASRIPPETAGAASETVAKDTNADAPASEEALHFHLETTLNKEELLRHIFGVVYGNCIGDAIGLLTEFMSKEEANQVSGRMASNNPLNPKHTTLIHVPVLLNSPILSI